MGLVEQAAVDGACVFGELSLDGSVRPVRGTLPMVISARERGVRRVLVSAANVNEVSRIDGLEIYLVTSLCGAASTFIPISRRIY